MGEKLFHTGEIPRSGSKAADGEKRKEKKKRKKEKKSLMPCRHRIDNQYAREAYKIMFGEKRSITIIV